MASVVEQGGLLDPSRFRICKTEDGAQLIANSVVWHIFLYPHYHSKAHIQEVAEVITHAVSQIKEIDRAVFVKRPDLATATQRYNQSVARAVEERFDFSGVIKLLKLRDTPDSLERVLTALKAEGKVDLQKVKPHEASDEQTWRIGLRSYEEEVLYELIRLAREKMVKHYRQKI
jgi:hypothetical protein